MPLNQDRVAELHAGIAEYVARRQLASCQYALGLAGEVVVTETVGDAPADARYRIFSSTKILPVAVIWQLVGEGLLDFESPVTTWWPEFSRNGKDAITLEHVLAHSAGVPTCHIDIDAYDDRDRRVAQMEDWELAWEPGTQFEYHGLTAHWILAELISRVTGLDHRVAVRERLLAPLGVDRLELGVPPERQHDVLPLIPTGSPATPEELAAVLSPALAAALAAMLPTEPGLPEDDPVLGPVSSAAGLVAGVPGASAVSDAASMALLYQGLLHNTHDLFEPRTLHTVIDKVANRHPTPLGHPVMRGLGTEIAGEGTALDRSRRLGSGFTSTRAFGHAGAGGQVAWADPETGLSFAFLTNGWDHNVLEVVRRDRLVNELATRCVSN